MNQISEMKGSSDPAVRFVSEGGQRTRLNIAVLMTLS